MLLAGTMTSGRADVPVGNEGTSRRPLVNGYLAEASSRLHDSDVLQCGRTRSTLQKTVRRGLQHCSGMARDARKRMHAYFE